MSAAPYDVAVIGGGPAGSSAAIHLARQGLRVVMCEAKTYPHHKVCGEFLSPECRALLADLDMLPALKRLGPVPIEVAEITAPGGAAWQTAFPAPALGLSRYALDAALAERAHAAGAEVRQATPITAVQGSLDEGFTLAARGTRAPIRARAVIAAHGKRSTLDRALERPFLARRQPYVGLKAHFAGPTLPGRIELHAFPGGYCGLSETETGAANVGVLVQESIFKRASGGRPDVDAFIAWMVASNPRLGAWFSRAEPRMDRWLSIAQVPFVGKTALHRDIVMAGDAAGVVMPLAGDGIAMALAGGQLAAAHVAAFLGGQASAATLRRSYQAAWQGEFAGRLRLARALHVVMLRPPLLGAALRVLAAVPPVGRYVLLHTRDARRVAQVAPSDP